jgi:hypothetical protein
MLLKIAIFYINILVQEQIDITLGPKKGKGGVYFAKTGKTQKTS